MVLARWTATVQDAEGNAVPGCEIEVRNASTGLLTQVYSDRDGTVPLGNPFVSADATFGFHVVGGAYRITARKGSFQALWNYVGIGTMAEFDFESIAFELEAGLYPVATLADLNAYIPGAEQTIAGLVLNDPDPSNNGYYLWSGTAWMWQRGLSDTLARLTVIGGTPNAIEVQASPGVDPGAALAFFIDPLAPNTGPVTIKINGDDPVPAYDYTGEDFVPGAFSGRVFLSREANGSLRSLMPADLAARAAQSASEAEASKESAALSSAAAGVASGRLEIASFAELATKFVYSAPGVGQQQVAATDLITWREKGFAYRVAAADATDSHLDYTASGGVKLYAIFDAAGYLHTKQLGATMMGVVPETDLLRKAFDIHPHVHVDGWLRIDETIEPPSASRLRGSVTQSFVNPIAQGSSRIVAAVADLGEGGAMFRVSPVDGQSQSFAVDHMQFVGDADIDPTNLHLAVDSGIFAFDLTGLKDGCNFNNCYFRGLRKVAYADGDPYTDQVVFNQCFFNRNYFLVDFRNSSAGTSGIVFNQCMAYGNVKFVNGFYDATFSDCTFQNSSYTAVRNDIIADNILWDGGWFENLIQPFQPRRSATVRALRCGELGAPPGSAENKFIFRAANGVTIRYIGSRIPTNTRFCTFLGVSDLSTVTIEMIGAYKTGATDGGFGDQAGIENYLGQINYRGIGNTNRPEWNYTGKRRITVSGSYTVTRGDEGCFIRSTSTGGSTITIPAETTYSMPIGGEIEIVNDGAGDITITATGAVIRNLSTSQESRTLAANGTALLRKSAGNIWHVIMN